MADDGRYLSGMSASVEIDSKKWELGEWLSWTHTEPLDVTDSESDHVPESGPGAQVVWAYRENIGDLTNRQVRLKGTFDSGAMPLATGKTYLFRLVADDGVAYPATCRVADIRRLSQSPVLQTVEIDAVSTGQFSPAIA